MTTIVYNEIAFNADVAAGKSEADFLKHEGHHDLSAEQLKEVHALAVKAVAAAPKKVEKPHVEIIKGPAEIVKPSEVK